MLSLTHGEPGGGLVLRDPLTGVAVALDEADLSEGLRDWLIEAAPRLTERPGPEDGEGAAA